VCRRLALDFASPVLCVAPRLLAEEDEPVEPAMCWYRPDRYEFRLHLRSEDDDAATQLRLA